jgi:hypothetical protein
MADYDCRCVNCMHRSHEDKECPYCDPKNRCTEFVRADLFIARSMARIEGGLQQGHGQTMMALSTIFDLLAEAFPAAADSLKVKLEERQAAAKAEMEAQQAQARAEADDALREAKDIEEEKALAEMAESYGKVLPFPKTAWQEEAEVASSAVDLAGIDTDPEVV